MNAFLKRCSFAATLFVASYGMGAEKAAPPSTPPARPAKSSQPSSAPAKAPAPAAPSSTSSAAQPSGNSTAAAPTIEQLKDQFKAQADAVLAERARMIEAFKKASESEREKLVEEYKKTLEAQRALGKQIRDDMRKMRQTSPASAGGGRR